MAERILTEDDFEQASREEQALLNQSSAVLKAQNDYLMSRVVSVRAAYNELLERYEALTIDTDLGDGITPAETENENEDENPED